VKNQYLNLLTYKVNTNCEFLSRLAIPKFSFKMKEMVINNKMGGLKTKIFKKIIRKISYFRELKTYLYKKKVLTLHEL